MITTRPEDIKFMQRCLELASKAEGLTYPNPLVGSVIVCDGNVVGEGYHLKAGEPHAEVNAINSVRAKEKLRHSTLYVNLEPCSHTGKTPPCADLIIRNSIPRVVIGTGDTSKKVSGKGIKRLVNAGCEVIAGVAEEECRIINRRFFTFHEKDRPYIILKWAQSADGFMDIKRTDTHNTEPNWISGKAERVLVHRWRASEQAILVGAGTIRADDPKLNVREWTGPDPLKIVLSGSGSFYLKPAAVNANGRLFVFSCDDDLPKGEAIAVKLNKNEQSAKQVTEYLFHSGIQSLLIEGGAMVLEHFISTGFWDEARIFTGKSFFKEGVKAPRLSGRRLSKSYFSMSCLETYLNSGC